MTVREVIAERLRAQKGKFLEYEDVADLVIAALKDDGYEIGNRANLTRGELISVVNGEVTDPNLALIRTEGMTDGR